MAVFVAGEAIQQLIIRVQLVVLGLTLLFQTGEAVGFVFESATRVATWEHLVAGLLHHVDTVFLVADVFKGWNLGLADLLHLGQAEATLSCCFVVEGLLAGHP